MLKHRKRSKVGRARRALHDMTDERRKRKIHRLKRKLAEGRTVHEKPSPTLLAAAGLFGAALGAGAAALTDRPHRTGIPPGRLIAPVAFGAAGLLGLLLNAADDDVDDDADYAPRKVVIRV